MQKLLSLPPNLVDCFHEIEGADYKDWFCTSDPIGAKLGSGGGTTWLLTECQKKNAPEANFTQWISQEKRILLHVPGYAQRQIFVETSDRPVFLMASHIVEYRFSSSKPNSNAPQ